MILNCSSSVGLPGAVNIFIILFDMAVVVHEVIGIGVFEPIELYTCTCTIFMNVTKRPTVKKHRFLALFLTPLFCFDSFCQAH